MANNYCEEENRSPIHSKFRLESRGTLNIYKKVTAVTAVVNFKDDVGPFNVKELDFDIVDSLL